MVSLDIDFIVANPTSPQNLVLKNKDELIVYKKTRYLDDEYVIISGAVRFPDTLLYDASNTMRLRDYIIQAGGLKKEAASFAHVHRINPFNPSEIEYKRVDLERAFNDNNAVDNIALSPYDSVYIYFEEDFLEDRTVSIDGAVNTPGVISFGKGMTLTDAIILAGGFKLSSATNEIEISRVIIRDNEPTKISILKVRSERDVATMSKSDQNVLLQPFDNIFVREVPEFELQQNITIEGEVKFPGKYSLIKSNETVFDIITRAGGITDEAFPDAAQLFRKEDSLGYVVMRLDEVLNNPNSIYNYNLKNGDVISIPKQKDYVTIRGATRAIEAVDRGILGPNNEINVPYHPGKTAKYYIDYYAGGFAPRADRKKIFVKHPNGEVRQVERKFLVASKYPEVRKGSVITVGYKEAELFGGDDKKDVDWTKVLGDSVGQAMSILTLILLVQRLD
jgi:protein involved in polysaccharide export with SLBB domain